MGHFVIHFFFFISRPYLLSYFSHIRHTTVLETLNVFFLFIFLKYKFWTFKSATVNVPVGNITVKKYKQRQ